MTATPVMTIAAPATAAAKMPVNHDDEESRYSWATHCATAEGRAKYAYCANPEPATGAVTVIAAPATAVAKMPVNHDDEESRYSWATHCATAEGRAKYAYCANTEPAALQELYGSSHSHLQNLGKGDYFFQDAYTQQLQNLSKGDYFFQDAYTQLQQLYGSSHSYLQNLDAANVKVMHLADWCKGNDSAEAKKICPGAQVSGEYSW
jgi:hypothetical protein